MSGQEGMKNKPRRHGPMGGPPGMMPGEKAKDLKGTSKKLLAYMGRYKIALIFVMIFAIGGTAFNIIGPKVLSKATTELFNGLMAKVSGRGGIDFEKIGRILLILLLLYLFSALLSFIQGYIMTGISQKLSYRFRREISEKINRMPLAYFESKTVGDVLSRITNDVDTLGQSLSQSITTLITSVTTIIGVLVMMLSISPLMTLIALVILPISGALIGVVMKFSQKYFTAQQTYLGKINGQIEETFSGHNIIKAFDREEKSLQEFSDTNQVLFRSAWKSQFISGMMQPIMTFVGNLGYVAVAISGSVLAIQGVINVGEIQAFIQYVKSFTQPIVQLAQVSNMFQSAAAAAERVFEFLEEKEEDMTAEHPVHLVKTEGEVSFEHVQFGYTPDKIIINDFSCGVKPGQMVAIVGPTGAGKTTMVKLLMRFYDVAKGSNTGMLNGVLRDLGILKEGMANISFLEEKTMWRPIFYLINIWKETGWGTIIFLATLAGINPELYEAADIDGASRFQKMRYVTLPALGNTIITVLILNLAKVMNMFESVFVLYNASVYTVSDVISTYIYRQTFDNAVSNYGYSTAVGLFKSLVGCFLVLVCNKLSKKIRGRGIV